MSSQNEKPSTGHQPDDQTTPNQDLAKAAEEKEKGQGGGDEKSEKKPPGGYDSTPVAHAPPGYTVKFTFHRATKLPMADLSTMSSDPYLYAQLTTSLPARHKEDPVMRFRTPTVWKSTDPEWNEVWVVAHVPSSGFKLKVRVYDEDQSNQDDRLGNAHVKVGHIDENWQGIHNQAYKIAKRSGSWRAYGLRALAVCFREAKEMSGHLYISAEVLGKSEGSDGGRCYTVGHQHWSRHYSPLLGRIANRKDDSDNDDNDEPGQDNSEFHNTTQRGPRSGSNSSQKKKTQRYNFQANQMQLRGPVPPELYHRFVEFRPLIGKLFRSKGLRGVIMHSALHHQHVQVYNYNKDTVYGGFDEPCDEMTRQFLDLVHYDTGGRIFTYVLTLDALMRFTETGKEFGIDMLSKHTMHSDASIYIAFSGEFFIRRRKHHDHDGQDQHHAPGPHDQHQQNHMTEKHNQLEPPAAASSSPSTHRINKPSTTNPKNKARSGSNASHPASNSGSDRAKPPRNPSDYEMFIDNDSGTYRPNAKLLPLLKKFLEANFPGLRVNTLDCQADEERMKRLKDEQRQRKKDSGNMQVFRQASRDGSISSSDESALDAAEAGADQGHNHALGEAAHALGQGSRPHVGNLFKLGGTGE